MAFSNNNSKAKEKGIYRIIKRFLDYQELVSIISFSIKINKYNNLIINLIIIIIIINFYKNIKKLYYQFLNLYNKEINYKNIVY